MLALKTFTLIILYSFFSIEKLFLVKENSFLNFFKQKNFYFFNNFINVWKKCIFVFLWNCYQYFLKYFFSCLNNFFIIIFEILIIFIWHDFRDLQPFSQLVMWFQSKDNCFLEKNIFWKREKKQKKIIKKQRKHSEKLNIMKRNKS